MEGRIRFGLQKAAPQAFYGHLSQQKTVHSPNTLFKKELRSHFAPIIQGKSGALRVLILSRDDLRDTTPPISWGLLKRSPFYTWRCQRLFGTDLPFCASRNKGSGNIDKMGKRVKREKEMPAGIFFRLRRVTNRMFFARPV